MKPRGISSLVDQQQVSGRTSRGKGDSLKSWAERSVWSLVCAMELGLISEPRQTSVSFAALSNDGSPVRTSASVSKEFPSINSPIPGNRNDRDGMEFVARMPTSRTARKSSLKLTSRDKRMRSLTTERNATVDHFWKSCKRRVGRPKKRVEPNREDSEFKMKANLCYDRIENVQVFPGIARQVSSTSRSLHAKKSAVMQSSIFQMPTTAARNSYPDRKLSRGGDRLVGKRRTKRRTKRGRPARIVENVDPSKIVPSYSRSAAAACRGKEKVLNGDTTIDVQWEYREQDLRPSTNAREDRESMMNDLRGQHFQTTCYESASPNHTPIIEESPSTSDTEDAYPAHESENSQEFFVHPGQATMFDDVHTLPLAERISTGSKSSTDDVDYSAKSDDEDRPEYPEKNPGSSDFCTVSNHSNVGSENEEPSPIKRRRRRTKCNRRKCSLVRRDKVASERRVLGGKNNDARCKSAESVRNCYGKQTSVKRNKVTANGNVNASSIRKFAKNHTQRAKIFKNDEEYHDLKRVTRGSTKISKENFVGKLVWGSCSGWWPALIIDADHVGMLSEAGKLWVYWIGEARISLLNEKTQIESFTCNLHYRLMQNSNVARSRAIDATMQILRARLGCTLTKPYSSWIENNFSDGLESLDEFKFYPYPNRIQQRLNCLKEKNSKVTEKYLLDQKREAQVKKVIERPKESPQPNDADASRLPLKEQHPGVITWAKIAGHNWWPAMIIDYRDCCMREPGFGCQWIMWYGDYKLSEVHHQSFMRFDRGIEKLRDYINNTKKHAYLVGVLQAAKDYCSRLGCETDNWTLVGVFKYFSKTDRLQPQYDHPRKGDSVKIYDKYSAHIVKQLNELKNNPNIDDKRADDLKSSDDLRSVVSGKVPLESLCLKCLKTPSGATEAHPFFEGSLCKDCSEQYKPCMFVFGNDAKCFYCTICASSGMVIICDNEDCPRVYCTACMKHLLCPTTYDNVLQEDPWECFLCQGSSGVSSDTIVRPRPNWKDKIIDMFRTKSNSNMQVARCEKKRRIRVLSLFDGLSTGLLVLLKLGLAVDVYYASEIDPDALMVSASHFGDRIVHLGDVMDITCQKIKEMTPIDLLIGGSPCNDLSLANPARLGLHDPKGTGVLFFEYCRIMKLVKKLNNGRPLFWMYENVASMPTEYRLEMNKHLGQEPDVIDSADFSPQHRLRLYWHNLPMEPHSLSSQGEQDVQDILTPHCQRYALVKKIRTVTTKVNSLKQGKSALKPILMKDESDSLWITELEEIFGFPRHYTDVKNLSATKRQRLIGKSWSVQTLTAILGSLCPYFECNTVNE
ncbi:uncharacterized protein LOC128887437 isoform X1 [Hylaeus anthracinus]|uniref:uncharacterized protein LOC128887437 isoform X1 n=2 Tax=Hylaeus anthracinus TaxID=313031 RepID=UPI0023BA0CC0|nr:uncharacterized protein LOC128887437 isoform X1 [Hylaeus anthracinus]XP_053999264.1 uncharacterized protein LOC128887437 isoform X1 [Hylaeus anthracinus]XP_053999265.1 uncharacterized protein LOC128887437 isoform X1 [Hylaeus anthracinus]